VQRIYTNKEEASSPTARTESIFLISTVDAAEEREIMTADIPNAFIQTDMDNSGRHVIIKIKGSLAEIRLKIEPERYKKFAVMEGDTVAIYVVVRKVIYGMLQFALLFYKKLRSDLELGLL
jgi:hypothetical protein